MVSKHVAMKKGLGLGSILTIIFALSKVFQLGLCSTWSWWWVFSPLWIPIAVIIVFILFCLVMAGIAAIFK